MYKVMHTTLLILTQFDNKFPTDQQQILITLPLRGVASVIRNASLFPVQFSDGQNWLIMK